MPESVRSCSPSAAAFSSASVVTPSSRQIRAAVFGPSPGSRMNDATSPGTSARRLASASMSPGLDDLDDLRLDRLADVGQLLRLALERELGDRRGRVADPRRGAPVGGDAKRLLAEDLGQVGQQVEPVREIAVARERRDHATDHRAGRDGQDWPMRAMVCLPTYNERENLEPMVRALGEQLDTARDRVLVIDDNSPDGTGAIADALAAELALGRGAAPPGARPGSGRLTSPGSSRALAAGAELVLEIDCDFSHDPKDVPRLIAACEAGADSRSARAGSTGGGTVNWGRGRMFISRGGSLYARTILGVGVRDLTGGFKCFRRAVLETIDLDAIAAKGYGFQIETTYRALRGRVHGRRDPDHLRRPAGRRVEDGRLDRRRGDAPGAGAALPRAPRLGCSAWRSPYTCCDGRGHRRDVRRRGARRARSR